MLLHATIELLSQVISVAVADPRKPFADDEVLQSIQLAVNNGASPVQKWESGITPAVCKLLVNVPLKAVDQLDAISVLEGYP